MKPTRDLAVLMELAQRRRDDALQALAAVRREQLTAQGQMEQLRAYTRDADARWLQRASAGVTPMLLATQRQFVARLEEAIAFQTDVLQRLQERVAHAEARVQHAERALATLQRIQQRRQLRWLEQQRRVEQKATDEMAAAQHRRRATMMP
ncbi:flagellar export protein FliJ [Tepidimonas sp.]|uniref:flagellar export protein FliJ n=1 Tax=Tepidimonas sp. TaxID=2002775 RepID=UPI002FE07766